MLIMFYGYKFGHIFGIRKIKCFTFSSYFALEFITSKKRGKNAFSRSFDQAQFLKLLVQCILNLLIIAEFSKKKNGCQIYFVFYLYTIFKKNCMTAQMVTLVMSTKFCFKVNNIKSKFCNCICVSTFNFQKMSHNSHF